MYIIECLLVEGGGLVWPRCLRFTQKHKVWIKFVIYILRLNHYLIIFVKDLAIGIYETFLVVEMNICVPKESYIHDIGLIIIIYRMRILFYYLASIQMINAWKL